MKFRDYVWHLVIDAALLTSGCAPARMLDPQYREDRAVILNLDPSRYGPIGGPIVRAVQKDIDRLTRDQVKEFAQEIRDSE